MMGSGMIGGAMMNREQMRQMMGANADFARMFLQMMIPHHEAGIAMAQQALTQAGAFGVTPTRVVEQLHN